MGKRCSSQGSVEAPSSPRVLGPDGVADRALADEPPSKWYVVLIRGSGGLVFFLVYLVALLIFTYIWHFTSFDEYTVASGLHDRLAAAPFVADGGDGFTFMDVKTPNLFYAWAREVVLPTFFSLHTSSNATRTPWRTSTLYKLYIDPEKDPPAFPSARPSIGSTVFIGALRFRQWRAPRQGQGLPYERHAAIALAEKEDAERAAQAEKEAASKEADEEGDGGGDSDGGGGEVPAGRNSGPSVTATATPTLSSTTADEATSRGGGTGRGRVSMTSQVWLAPNVNVTACAGAVQFAEVKEGGRVVGLTYRVGDFDAPKFLRRSPWKGVGPMAYLDDACGSDVERAWWEDYRARARLGAVEEGSEGVPASGGGNTRSGARERVVAGRYEAHGRGRFARGGARGAEALQEGSGVGGNGAVVGSTDTVKPADTPPLSAETVALVVESLPRMWGYVSNQLVAPEPVEFQTAESCDSRLENFNIPCSGLVIDFPLGLSLSNAAAVVEWMENFKWIDEGTRGVAVEVVGLNYPTEYFVLGTFIIPIPVGGLMTPVPLVRTFRSSAIFELDSLWNLISFFCSITLTVAFIFLLLQWCRECCIAARGADKDARYNLALAAIQADGAAAAAQAPGGGAQGHDTCHSPHIVSHTIEPPAPAHPPASVLPCLRAKPWFRAVVDLALTLRFAFDAVFAIALYQLLKFRLFGTVFAATFSFPTVYGGHAFPQPLVDIASQWRNERVAVAVVVVMSFIRGMTNFRVSPSVTLLFKTVSEAMTLMGPILFCMLFLFVGYWVAGMALFGQMAGGSFQTVANAASTLFFVATSGGEEVFQRSRWLEPTVSFFYYGTFYFLIAMIALNLVLAVVVESLDRMDGAETRQSMMQVGQHFLHALLGKGGGGGQGGEGSHGAAPVKKMGLKAWLTQRPPRTLTPASPQGQRLPARTVSSLDGGALRVDDGNEMVLLTHNPRAGGDGRRAGGRLPAAPRRMSSASIDTGGSVEARVIVDD